MTSFELAQKDGFNAALRTLGVTEKKLVKAYMAAKVKIAQRVVDEGGKLTLAWAQSMYSQINAEIQKIIIARTRIITWGHAEIYKGAYYSQLYGVEQQVNLYNVPGIKDTHWTVNAPLLRGRAVEAALQTKIGGVAFLERNALERTIMQQTTREAVTTAIAAGDSPRDLARDLEDLLDISTARATRVARTELLRAYSFGQDEADKISESAGVAMNYKWSSTLDSRTRRDHREMDQKKAEIINGEVIFTLPDGTKGAFPRDVTLSAKESVNCRCRRVAVVAGFTPSTRAAKVEGKWTKVGMISYPEWQASLKL